MHSETMPWIVFTLQNQNFAISAQNVAAISKSQQITRLPKLPDYIPGIIRYREEVFRLYDLRTLISLKTFQEELLDFSEIMEQRKQDHIKWLKELELSVTENREFNLTADPHKCAFGKWYYNYKTDNLLLNRLLGKFEKPHYKIHSIAHKIEDHKKHGEHEKAKEIILQTRTQELSQMINLFEEVKKAYKEQNSQQVIILKNYDKKCALAVDNVTSVESIDDVDNVQEYDSLLKSSRVPLNLNLGKSKSGNFVVRFWDEDFLCNKF